MILDAKYPMRTTPAVFELLVPYKKRNPAQFLPERFLLFINSKSMLNLVKI